MVRHLGVGLLFGSEIFCEHAEDQRVEVTGLTLPRLFAFGSVVQLGQFAILVLLKPGHAALEHVGDDGQIVVLSQLEPVDHQCRGVSIGIAAWRPAPATIAVLHAIQVGEPLLHQPVDGDFVVNGIGCLLVPLRSTLCGVTDFLRIQVGDFVAQCGEIHPGVLQNLLGQDRRHEAVEYALAILVRIGGEVGQGIDHG